MYFRHNRFQSLGKSDHVENEKFGPDNKAHLISLFCFNSKAAQLLLIQKDQPRA